jgi:hypothetical protein
MVPDEEKARSACLRATSVPLPSAEMTRLPVRAVAVCESLCWPERLRQLFAMKNDNKQIRRRDQQDSRCDNHHEFASRFLDVDFIHHCSSERNAK